MHFCATQIDYKRHLVPASCLEAVNENANKTLICDYINSVFLYIEGFWPNAPPPPQAKLAL